MKFIMIGDMRRAVAVEVEAADQDAAVEAAKNGNYTLIQTFQSGKEDFEWAGVFVCESGDEDGNPTYTETVEATDGQEKEEATGGET